MRTLDGKYSIRDNKGVLEIFQTATGVAVPDDEPLFLLRGRDRLAVQTLLAYGGWCARDDCTGHHMDGINKAISRFTKFLREHPERMKQLGVTKGR